MSNYFKLILTTACFSFFSNVVIAYPRNVTAYNEDEKVVGGFDISITQAPHQVLISTGCGGSILNRRFILTAAHCIISTTITVRIGSDRYNQGGILYNVMNNGIHPKYRFPDYDVAFVKTSVDMQLDGRFAKPVVLANEHFIVAPGTKLFATGFGFRENGQPSPILQGIFLSALAPEVCKRNSIMFTDRMICAGTETGKNVCKGDSGGPLVLDNGVQVGITSFGIDGSVCRKPPGYYVKVSNPEIRQWIRSNTGA